MSLWGEKRDTGGLYLRMDVKKNGRMTTCDAGENGS